MLPKELRINVSEQIDMKLDVQRILNRLSEKDRSLIERHCGFGYTFADIARFEGVSRAAIHKRFNRIILEIRDQLRIVTSGQCEKDRN